MEKEQIFNFINDNPIFALATCVGCQPHVRSMRIYSADDDGIIFNTSRSKRLHQELQANPLIEMCFYNNVQGIQIRIRGKAILINGTNIKTRIREKIPVLSASLLENGKDALEIYQLVGGRANIWQIDEQFDSTRLTDQELSSVWMAVYPGRQKVNA